MVFAKMKNLVVWKGPERTHEPSKCDFWCVYEINAKKVLIGIAHLFNQIGTYRDCRLETWVKWMQRKNKEANQSTRLSILLNDWMFLMMDISILFYAYLIFIDTHLSDWKNKFDDYCGYDWWNKIDWGKNQLFKKQHRVHGARKVRPKLASSEEPIKNCLR